MIANRKALFRGIISGFILISTVWMFYVVHKSLDAKYFELCIQYPPKIWRHFNFTEMINTETLQQKTIEHENNNITVVTAYFDIGTFPKGSLNIHFTSEMYYNWATTFKYLRNPVVVYTDSERFKQHMYTVRQDLMNMTKIVLIKRSSSWAFKNINKIKALFSSKKYPKHYPNTVIAEYTCAQHAKHDVVARAAKQDYFGTKYYMWLDVGYFRKRVNIKRPFRLVKPKNFDENKIAMTRVYPDHLLNAKPKDIFLQNIVYVGGGLVFGEKRNILKFSSQFKHAANYFLEQNLTNTDQQVIYAMFSNEGQNVIKPEVELQCYDPVGAEDWRYLGYLMTEDN